MSLSKMINKLIQQPMSGLIKDVPDPREYAHIVNKTTAVGPSTVTTSTTGTGGTLTNAQLHNAYKMYMTNSTGASVTSNTWDNWTREEKKSLAKVGFKFDKKAKEWILDLSASIRIPQTEGFQMLAVGASDKPTDQMKAHLKQLKERLIEKITAKLILAELVKPREIEE